MKSLFSLFLLFFISSGFAQATTEDNQLKFTENYYEGIKERIKENYNKSNELFEQCALINKKNDAVFYNMAQNYFDLKDFEKSLLYIDKAKKLDPHNKWYQKLFIEIQIQKGTDSKTLYKLIADYRPIVKNKYVISDLYRQISVHSYKKPVIKYQKINSVKDINGLNTLFANKDYNTLAKASEKLLEKEPDNAKAYYFAAFANKELKKYNEALDFLDMGMDFIMKDKKLLKDYYKLYVEIYTLTGKKKKASSYQKKMDK